jgi:TldD protein
MSSTDILEIATNSLLAPAELTEADMDRALSRLLRGGVDRADLYFQHTRHESWVLEDGEVKEGTATLEQGVGVRAVAGEKTGFAYSDDIVLPALMRASEAASAIARSGTRTQVTSVKGTGMQSYYPPLDPLVTLSDEERLDLLRRVDEATRRTDQRVKQVIASIVGVHDIMLVRSSDGVLAADVRPLVRMNVSVIVEQDGRREQGYAGGGARGTFAHFLDEDRALGYGAEAVRQALVSLEAIPAPAGEMSVVLGPGWPGILLHEAIGHGLEGDFNRKGTSAFSGRVGEKVASEFCTVVDDGTLADRRGSLNVDDEGTQTQCTTLIDEGRLCGYMQDKLNAGLMGVAPTGNGRRESFAHLPMPRMTNTYMLPGPHDPGEIIASVRKGIFAPNFGGGQVDITSGKFVFSASEAYLIEDGRLGAPIRGATLIGDGPTALSQVSMVGNDLEFDTGVGTCGKDGQSVPVGVGQPTLRIDGLTVGGTA